MIATMAKDKSFDEQFFSRNEILATGARLWPRWLSQARYGSDVQDHMGLTLSEFLRCSDQLITLAFKAIKSGCYSPAPATMTVMKVDKLRPFMKLAWLDRWVISHLARIYSRHAEPSLSPQLFSYRKGLGQHQAIKQLANFIASRKNSSVFRTDIHAFGENLVHHFCQSDFERITQPSQCLRLLFHLMAKFPFIENSRAASLIKGLPMGSHLQLVAENVYLDSLDRRLTAIDGGFYARFGDDMVFAHESPDVVDGVSNQVGVFANERGLTLNSKKTLKLSLLPPHLVGALLLKTDHTARASCILYLGKNLDWRGKVLLPREKARLLYHFFSSRLRSLELKCLDKTDSQQGLGERIKFLCIELQKLVDGALALGCEPICSYLKEIEQVEQLKQLDRWFLELVLSLGVSKNFKKGYFRHYPPKRLRAFGLESLVHLRNTGRL